MSDPSESFQGNRVAEVIDDLNQLAALSLTAEAFAHFRDYRNWLVADGDDAERIATVLTLYVLDLCESPPRELMH